MRGTRRVEQTDYSIRNLRSISRSSSRRSSTGSMDKSKGGSSQATKKAEKKPFYYVLDNCYLCTWGQIKTSSLPQPSLIFFATGELLLGYLQVKNKSLLLNGPIFMVSPNGSVLLCECSMNRLEGVGLFRLSNGDLVIGEWKDGFKNGSTISYNIESDKKIYAAFFKGEVQSLIKAEQGAITAKDLEELFPEVDLSLEELVASSPLFCLERLEDSFFVGSSDKKMGLRINNGQSFDIGFFENGKPHGHCRRVELDGNFIDGIFEKGDLHGPAVCFLKEMGLWTFGIYDNFTIVETKDVFTNTEILPLAVLSEITWPGSDLMFSDLTREIEPFIELDPFMFSEIEAEYVKSAMEGTSLPLDSEKNGIEMFLPRTPDQIYSQCMEAISEEPTLEDIEEEGSTKLGEDTTKRCSNAESKKPSHVSDLSSRF